jgi:hypothetical protein
MTDYKEYAKQMRENAVKNEQGNIVCSPELWEEIASVIERAIIPPCKVGDTAYVPWTWDGQEGVGFAEVEEIKIYDNKNHKQELITAKAEAYKEFAERLKEKLFEPVETWLESDIVRECDIDNLLKELVGDDK